MKESVRFSKARAWLIIGLAILTISGSVTAGFLYYCFLKDQRATQPKFNIVAITQSSADLEALHTVYLAELLGLSYDRPVSLYTFNENEAKHKLLASPLIKEAHIKKITPGTLDIHYTVRKPIAFLGERSNTVFDQEGFLFPFKPFFTPKKLPKVYLGGEGFDWGKTLKGPTIRLAFDLLQLSSRYLDASKGWLKQMDVSHAYDPSYGQRQIILIIEQRLDQHKQGQHVLHIEPRILRLSTQHYQKELALYQVLSHYLDEQIMNTTQTEKEGVVKRSSVIIDMRVSQLAYIRKQ